MPHKWREADDRTAAQEAIRLTGSDLMLKAEVFSSGWQTALNRPPKIDVRTVCLTSVPPPAVSVAIHRKQIKTYGFEFQQACNGDELEQSIAPCTPNPTTKLTPEVSRPPTAPHRRTSRIMPPRDVIKLQDRLYYLLQPPLETLLSRQSFQLPFEPFPFQYQGIAFLYPRYSAILADEMGLGKTMQAIITMCLLLRAREISSVLLVCPKPLVSNWQREFALWSPEIPVVAIEGNQQRRIWQWRHPGIPVRIANYELLMRDREVVTNSDLHFDLVVLDEAQRIKNRSCTTSQVVRSVSRSRGWALTGTPIENSPDDLVGIFEFLAPGYLSTGMTPHRMGKMVRDHILRRTKDRVLTDLPPKLFRDAEVELTPQQRETYQMAESEGILRLNEMGQGLMIQHVFELILRLKQICNFDPATACSSKLERLTADLEEVASSSKKAIIFSQWVETLIQLRTYLSRFGPLEYHGRISPARRDRVIEQFRRDPGAHVLLMSYGAGSVGLNLQFASYVFLFDRWWNPAVEDQAINRAHRIGSTGPVTVTRFITLGTIEERINQVLCEKREIFDAILSQTDAPCGMGLTQQEIFGLFDLSVPLPRFESAA